jgi:hypothetical protein
MPRYVPKLFAAAVLAGAVPLFASAPAAAAPVHDPMQLRNAVPVLTEAVQYRRWNRRGWRHRHYRHRDRWVGPAAGLAAGAIIGGAIASQQRAQAAANAEIEYCMQRFRSYDPASGTYLGYDGRRHPCP